MLAHVVFFTLKDSSAAAQQRLLDGCLRDLTSHPGTVFFGVGPRTPDLCRPVNDQTYHFGLHVIFASRADHDRYQLDERHLRFVAEQRDNWAQVRVFDSDLP